MGDYWEQGDMVFVHQGKRYGISQTGRTVCLGPVEEVQQPATMPCQPTPTNSQGCYKFPEVSNYQGKSLPSNVTGKIEALISQGLSTRAIAKETGVSNVTVYRLKKSKGTQLELAGVK